MKLQVTIQIKLTEMETYNQQFTLQFSEQFRNTVKKTKNYAVDTICFNYLTPFMA